LTIIYVKKDRTRTAQGGALGIKRRVKGKG